MLCASYTVNPFTGSGLHIKTSTTALSSGKVESNLVLTCGVQNAVSFFISISDVKVIRS